MREFTFRLVYDSGTDPLMDVFMENPELIARSFDICISDNQFWRVELFAGTETALKQVEQIRFDDEVDSESITTTNCQAHRYHDFIEKTSNRRVIYTYFEDISHCESIHTIAGQYLDPGLIFATSRQTDQHKWRILMRNDTNIGIMYDTLGGKLRDGISFQMDHLRDAERWQQDVLGGISLPAKQQRVLQEAADAGYYETPRETTLEELTDKLQIPRSTISYRLRQAESQLVDQFLESQLG